MFVHAVHFSVQQKELRKYRKDSIMWAGYAKKAKGFISYRTFKRLGYINQYASVYYWESKAQHQRFMKEFHDWLVAKSKAKVKVLGYYNLQTIDKLI